MRHELVIFDNSGVLVNSEFLANRCLADLLTEHGVPTTFSEAVDNYLGLSLPSVIARVEEVFGTTLRASFETELHGRLHRAFADELTPVPGVLGVLDEVESRKAPWCIATNDTRARAERSLSAAGILPRTTPEQLVTVDDVTAGKPAPDLFLHAAALNGTAPRACLVIEDSQAGVRAARSAGMTVVAFAGLTPRDRLDEAHHIVTSMADLRAALPALLDR
ncbi:HAD family phosphatase [Streptomyces sp. NPDC005566]|uniref:HAD family hydrolase n=1 Tax=Streptomyces sp. NPDC005566 TaxID=3156886 RepID=UPI0033BE6D0B